MQMLRMARPRRQKFFLSLGSPDNARSNSHSAMVSRFGAPFYLGELGAKPTLRKLRW